MASSYVAQVFGCEHECSVREGDLVTKNSWIAKVQDVQVSCLELVYVLAWFAVQLQTPPHAFTYTGLVPGGEATVCLLFQSRSNIFKCF